MIGLLSDDAPTGFAFSYLFGGQLACALPLPGLVIDGGSAVWVLDWRVADPPKQEAYDSAIERILREQEWSGATIDRLRQPQGQAVRSMRLYLDTNVN